MMITTNSSFRRAIDETQTPSSPLPLFALPHGSVGHREVSPRVALSELSRARAAFIGKNVAAILD